MSTDKRLDNPALARFRKLADTVGRLQDNGLMAPIQIAKRDGDIAIMVVVEDLQLSEMTERACIQLKRDIARMIGARIVKIACNEIIKFGCSEMDAIFSQSITRRDESQS